MLKSTAKAIVARILGWQVKRLLRTAPIKVIAVAGSVGKTSTKFAIAEVLKQKYRVRFQEGNYNHVVTVPLVLFGLPEPTLFNPLAWLKTFVRIERTLRQDCPYDVAILELGTDGPGQLKQFKNYLSVDIGVITGISPEHMESFGTLKAVATEELAISQYSSRLVINADLCDKTYLKQISNYVTYGIYHEAEYYLDNLKFSSQGYKFQIKRGRQLVGEADYDTIMEAHLYSALAGATVGDMLELTPAQILTGIKQIQPVNGRGRRLKGVKGSLIIDDTYNSSPDAAKAALDALYKTDAPQRIVLLGNMNELGDYSEQAHKELGQYCDSQLIDEVITIGPEANAYLAPAAAAKGCKVNAFDTPYEAGEYIKSVLKPGAAVLAKGSQNRVFAEEAIKTLLADPKDAAKLVRQSPDWLRQKAKQFN